MTMQKFIEPKSDQLNSDDLFSGSRVIRVTKVKVTSEAQQACTIWYEGDNGKPWKPCKSMGRVLVFAWGIDPQNYVGKYIELYRDPEAIFGGQKVGGIRVSALSDIEADFEIALTVSRGTKRPTRIKKLTIKRDRDHSLLNEEGKDAASRGMEEYKTWFSTLTGTEKKTIEAQHAGWKESAVAVDSAKITGESDHVPL